jgi:adenylate cyclase
MSVAPPLAAPTIEELLALRELAMAVDDLLEQSLVAREGLDEVFARLLPEVLRLTGARGAAVTTKDEHLEDRTWTQGDLAGHHPERLLSQGPKGVRLLGADTFVSQVLDVVGTDVGQMGLLFAGDLTAPDAAARARRVLQTVAETLDTVLESVHTAAEKQRVVMEFSEHLSHPVFESGIDRAILALAQHIRLPGIVLVHRDGVEAGVLHYRLYREGHLQNDSGDRRFPALEAAIDRFGTALLSRGDDRLRKVLEPHRTMEAVLISGAPGEPPLGKIVVWNESAGFSSFALDVLHLLAATLSQRLIDYNRERIHLSQFFSCAVIDELIRDPQYQHNFLSPRDAEIGILFADINAFTKICERVLETPQRIGRFVDRWSDGVVDILWRHGGVFDKMVGDCVIGLFGPPFFRSGRLERAEASLHAASEIQAFTASMSADPELAALAEAAELPGLGVAIGVNLAHTFCGMFGPNHNYTGFSSGMNQTARLQSLGHFREILVMESVRTALGESADAFVKGLTFGPLEETSVKNVALPLRYHRLLGAAVRP